MFFIQCLQSIFCKESVDPSNESLLLNGDIKDDLLEKYLDGSNNSLIFESDVEPLPKDISNEIQSNEKKSKNNYLKYFKRNIFTTGCTYNSKELKQSISEENEALTEEVPTVLDNAVATVTDTIINQTEVSPTVLDNGVATVTDTDNR